MEETNEQIFDVTDSYEENAVFLKLYSIFDKRAKMYSQPFVGQNDDVVKRNLKMDVMKSDLYKHNSDDFLLYRVGFINTLNAELITKIYPIISITDLLNTDNYKL